MNMWEGIKLSCGQASLPVHEVLLFHIFKFDYHVWYFLNTIKLIRTKHGWEKGMQTIMP